MTVWVTTFLMIALMLIGLGMLLGSRSPSQIRNQRTPSYRPPLYNSRTGNRENLSVRNTTTVQGRRVSQLDYYPSTRPLRSTYTGGRRTVEMGYSRRSGSTSSAWAMLVGTGSVLFDRLRYQTALWNVALKRGQKEKQVSWSGIALILLAVFLISFYTFRTFMPDASLAMAWAYMGSTTSAPATHASNPAPAPPAQQLVRISQLDPAQYNSPEEYHTWAYSACSSASMTEVINAYGHHYRITDILKVEARIGAITPELGLLSDAGIANTVAHFGFKTQYMHNETLDDVIKVANGGHPVIVSFPPDRYEGGHLLVLTGGDANYVYLADSSLWNRKVLSRAQFLHWWEGFAAIVTPA